MNKQKERRLTVRWFQHCEAAGCPYTEAEAVEFLKPPVEKKKKEELFVVDTMQGKRIFKKNTDYVV